MLLVVFCVLACSLDVVLVLVVCVLLSSLTVRTEDEDEEEGGGTCFFCCSCCCRGTLFPAMTNGVAFAPEMFSGEVGLLLRFCSIMLVLLVVFVAVVLLLILPCITWLPGIIMLFLKHTEIETYYRRRRQVKAKSCGKNYCT